MSPLVRTAELFAATGEMMSSGGSELWRKGVAAAGALVCNFGPASSQAQSWIVTVGARLGADPPYEGANHDVIDASPTFNLSRAGSWQRFTPPDGGTTLTLYSNRYIDFGPMARFRYARDDRGKLTGMDKIHWAAEPGAFVDLWPADWLRLRMEGRRGVVGHNGWVGDAGADLIYTGDRWGASIGPRVGFGDRRYMDTYFGVTPAEAARSPFINTPYEPGPGRRYAGVETAVSYRLGGGFKLIADVGYRRLASKAADSPLVKLAGSADQVSAGLSLRYSFRLGR